MKRTQLSWLVVMVVGIAGCGQLVGDYSAEEQSGDLCAHGASPPSSVGELVCNRPADCATCLAESCPVDLDKCLGEAVCAGFLRDRIACKDPVCAINWGQGPPYPTEWEPPKPDLAQTIWNNCFSTCAVRCLRPDSHAILADGPGVDLSCDAYPLPPPSPARLDLDVMKVFSAVDGVDTRLCFPGGECEPWQKSSRDPLPSFRSAQPIPLGSWVELVPSASTPDITILHRYQWSRPIFGYEEWDVFLAPDDVLDEAISPSTVDPSLGVVVVFPLDCNNRPLAGVAASISRTTETTQQLYYNGLKYVREADRTRSPIAAAAFVNVEPGTQLVTLFDPDTQLALNFVEVDVRAGVRNFLFAFMRSL